MNDLTFSEYSSFAWENLFFMRPEWLYAYIPVGLICIMFIITYQGRDQWKRSFAKHLLPFLTIKGTKRQFLVPKMLLIVLLSFITLAMAGPTWEKIERPGQKTEAALVVLLDLSRSMLAEDIQPNRIERAKLKLNDFFAAKPNTKTALIAYAGTAHSVVPFSKDYKTISRQMEALRPDIMPVQGTNLSEALDKADTLLAKIVAPSSILLVTDNITASDIQRISQTATHSHIEIMAVATPTGGTIPLKKGALKDKQGNTVIPRLDVVNLDQLSAMENVNVITVTLDDTDVKILAARIRQNLEFEIDLENVEEEWKDFGYWLLIPILFISLLWFRRGWKVHWIWLLFIVMGCNDAGEFNLEDQFFTKDQKAQRLLDKGENERAAQAFESGLHQGYAYYGMGDLEKAAEAYSNDVSPEGFYNLGVVYSQMGDLEAAQQAFDAALQQDPKFEKANTNLVLVTKTIDSLALIKAIEEGKSSEASGDPKEFQEYNEQPDEKDVAQESDEKYEGKGDIQEMVTKEVDESTIDIFEFDETIVIDKDAAKQTLLRQVTEDPSLFLRRKFAYQNKNRGKTVRKSTEAW